MHLVQDASLPAHVRNRIHIRFNYEKWMDHARIYERESFNEFIAEPFLFDKSLLGPSPNPQLVLFPIASIFDTDHYQPDNPKPEKGDPGSKKVDSD